MSAAKFTTLVVAFALTVVTAGCKGGSENTVKSVDTLVTTTKVRDTTVIKADTTVHLDTVKQTHNAPDAKKP